MAKKGSPAGQQEEAWDGQSALSLRRQSRFSSTQSFTGESCNAPVSDLISILLLTTALKVKL